MQEFCGVGYETNTVAPPMAPVTIQQCYASIRLLKVQIEKAKGTLIAFGALYVCVVLRKEYFSKGDK